MLFASHYTAANDCSPARSTLVTGLYSQQTGCLITGQSTLSTGFQTWGTMLRQHGYHTFWFGKWHLTRGDDRWTDSDWQPRARQLRILRGNVSVAGRLPRSRLG